MKKYELEKETFSVIGILGGTRDADFSVKILFNTFNQRINEVKDDLVKEDGTCSYYGLMSSYDTFLAPWKEFKEGLYLAGALCKDDASCPSGFTKWSVPKASYIVVEIEEKDQYGKVFGGMINFQIPLARKDLAMAAFDHSKNGVDYLLFPVKNMILPIHAGCETEKIAKCGNHCGYCFFRQCLGCEKEGNACYSYAGLFKNGVCPNVICCDEKGIDGCYACPELEDCTKGFFKTGEFAKASSVFIQREGKAEYEKVLKLLQLDGFNYKKELYGITGIENQLNLLYRYKNNG